MSAKIIEFPVKKKSLKVNTKTEVTPSIKQANKNNVKRIDDLNREEEWSNELFPPNNFTLIA